jgi:hypothetical protein
MIRFAPSRLYLMAAACALGFAAFSGWCAMSWLPALLPCALLLASAAMVLYLGLQPVIECHKLHLKIGPRRLAWSDIRRVDQTGWIAPLVAYLTLVDGTKIRLIYPGDAATANRLMSRLQQSSTQALINGVPWRQIFGEPETEAEPAARAPLPSPRYRILTEADEADVERLYHQLRTAGRFNDPEK